MAEIIIMTHGMTRAEQRGIFPGNESLDSDVLLPEKFSIQKSMNIVCANLTSSIRTVELLGLDFKIDFSIPVIDYGHWHAKALKELANEEEDELEQWLSDPYSAPHGGTSFKTLYDKSAEWLEHTNYAEPTLIVADANFLRMVLLDVLKAPLSSLFKIDIAPLTSIKFVKRHNHSKISLFPSNIE